MKKTTIFQNGLIWFGAGVSIAEILTGTYFAPLGFGKGLTAILLGHLIGCTLLYLSGLIGGRTGLSSMETVKLSFGQRGGLLFAFLNVLQLVGWTAIMIYDGALSAGGIGGSAKLWSLVIGTLIVIWILIGLTNLGWINKVAMAALLALTLVLCMVIFNGDAPVLSANNSLSFGAAVELAVAMPLSWLPLISDYTREAQHPQKATLVSAVVYGLVSCWMYVIGMGAALYTGGSDISQIMLKAGLGIAALAILILSTVTTTFLDAWSAGISAESLVKNISGKWIAVIVAAVGTVGAMLFPMEDITGFLYLIGSVFAPMIAIQIADAFLLHRNCGNRNVDMRNLVIWALGFAAYRYLMGVDTPIGSTLPDMLLTILMCIVTEKLLHSSAKQNVA